MYKSILDYFSKKCSKINLPAPRGPLSRKLLPSMIAAANTEVMHIINGSSAASKLKFGGERGKYNKYTPEFKAKLTIILLKMATVELLKMQQH